MSDEQTPNAVTAAVTPQPALPEDFDVASAIAIARDFAMSLYDRQFILRAHGISEPQMQRLEANAYYKQLLEQLTIEWNLPKSAQERLALHTAVGLETVLPDAIARISTKTEPLAGVAQMVKVLAEISGANAAARQKQAVAPSERFQITINLGAAHGGGKETYEISKPVIEVERIGVDQPDPEPADESGLRSLPAIQSLPEKA